MLEDVVRDTPGWSPADQLFALATLVILTADLEGDVIEIGSWCGRSTAALGIGARIAGRTRVIAVDLFPERADWHQNTDGTYSLKVRIGSRDVEAYCHQTVWNEPYKRDIAPVYNKYSSIYDAFEETIKKNELADFVKAIRGTSDALKAELPPYFKSRVAFIDGDHSYDAVRRDIQNVQPYLVDRGWICFDDAFTSYDGVNRAITECIIENPAYDICQQLTRKCFAARRKFHK
jgi:hypothetical protein